MTPVPSPSSPRSSATAQVYGVCIVTLSAATVQAVCDFLGLEYCDILINGDLLDCDVWDRRIMGTRHERDRQLQNFYVALELARSLGPQAAGSAT